MIVANISLGQGVIIDESSSVNNVRLGNQVKISKRCSVFGSATYILEIGAETYVGPNAFIQGYAAPVVVGARVSIAQNVNIMSNSGPNASPRMQQVFPLVEGAVHIGDDCWIGANAVILPGVTLGECCVVAANSLVSQSFEAFSVVGGNPARLLRRLNPTALPEVK